MEGEYRVQVGGEKDRNKTGEKERTLSTLKIRVEDVMILCLPNFTRQSLSDTDSPEVQQAELVSAVAANN